ncbi:MAG: hypothetical protein J2P36_26145 [Ktedonobacteraceae bacterium]|nr:hypothetical protein [Ktedonobacteraceae bacterium]
MITANCDIPTIMVRVQRAYEAYSEAIRELSVDDLNRAREKSIAANRALDTAVAQANCQLRSYGLRVCWRRCWLVAPYDFYASTEPIPAQ